MADSNSMDDVIDNTQSSMGGEDDFISFEEITSSIPEGKIEDNKEGDESLNFNDVDLNNDDDKPKTKSDDKETKDDKESKEASSKDDKKGDKETPDQESKKLVAELGEDKVEIDMLSKVKIPIDGKEVEMTLQEVVNKASGIEAVDKRFSELNNEKNQYKTEKNQYDIEKNDLMGKVTDFATAVNNQDANAAISALATLSGHNPIELRKQFKDLMINQVRAYEKLTPEQQKEFDNDQKDEYHQQEREMLNQKIENQQSNTDLTNSLLRFQAKHGVNDAAIVALYDEAEAKSINIENAEDLERYHIGKLSQERSSNLISQVDPSLSKDESALNVVNDFIVKNPEMSDEDVIQAIKTAIGNEDEKNDVKDSNKEKSLSDKIKSKQDKNLKGKQSGNDDEFSEDDDELLSFNEIGYY